ncbi:MAG: serine hydroxymethyltransferase [Candidatus Babeliales bacterium]
MKNLAKIDTDIFSLIQLEQTRQETTLDLIASENYTSLAVMEATGSVLTNKYAEGYPGKRYYGGCEFVDKVELLAQERCKEIFHAEHVNVQPHAGSQANMAVYFAALNFGDTIMGMSLAEGGHLTHGHKVNFSGKLYSSIQYTVNRQTELLDYDEIEKLAEQYKPKLIIAGASAYSRAIDFARFKKIAKQVGAYLMADIAHIAGLVATGLHENPFPHAEFVTSTTHKTLRGPRGGLIMCKRDFAQKIDAAVMPGLQGGPFMQVIAGKAVAFKQALEPEFKDYQKQVLANAKIMAKTFQELGYRIVSGGTDTHLFIIDLRNQRITGKLAEQILERVGISVSRSCIPFDLEQAWVTSGIRVGSPAISTRGIKENEAIQIVHFMHEALEHRDDDLWLDKIRKEVKTLCARHPIYVF